MCGGESESSPQPMPGAHSGRGRQEGGTPASGLIPRDPAPEARRSLRHGLRSQYPRLSERGDLLPRLGRIQLAAPDHHHLPGHRGHAARALHQDRRGRDHPLRHHLPEPPLAQQLVPGAQGEQRRTHPHRGRDADQPHQRQGNSGAGLGIIRVNGRRRTWGGLVCLFVCPVVGYLWRPEPAAPRPWVFIHSGPIHAFRPAAISVQEGSRWNSVHPALASMHRPKHACATWQVVCQIQGFINKRTAVRHGSHPPYLASVSISSIALYDVAVYADIRSFKVFINAQYLWTIRISLINIYHNNCVLLYIRSWWVYSTTSCMNDQEGS